MSDTTPVVVVIGRKSYVPLRNDDDEVGTDNINAIALGLMAHQFQFVKNDPERAALYWGPNRPDQTGRMAGAFDLLDRDREETEQAEVSTFSVSPDFGGGNVWQVR